MSKELELWYRIVEYLKETTRDIRVKEVQKSDDYIDTLEGYPISTIEKSLKALEIIKRHTTKDGIHIDFNKMMVAAMKNCDNFTWIANEEIISEIHLLKEVLL